MELLMRNMKQWKQWRTSKNEHKQWQLKLISFDTERVDDSCLIGGKNYSGVC